MTRANLVLFSIIPNIKLTFERGSDGYLECETCSEVLLDFDKEEEEKEVTETICCGSCGEEYDRHIGDVCPRCGHNNHEQHEEKY